MIRYCIAAAMVLAVVFSTVANAGHKHAPQSARRAAAKALTWEECGKALKKEWETYGKAKDTAFRAFLETQKKERAKLYARYPFYLEAPDAGAAGGSAQDSGFMRAAKRAAYEKAVQAAYDAYASADRAALDAYDAAAGKLVEAYNKAAKKAYTAAEAGR
jgi:hypothetical protein